MWQSQAPHVTAAGNREGEDTGTGQPQGCASSDLLLPDRPSLQEFPDPLRIVPPASSRVHCRRLLERHLVSKFLQWLSMRTSFKGKN